MKTILLVALYCLLAWPSHADEPRYRTKFTSKDGLHELRLLRTRTDSVAGKSGDFFYSTIEIWAMFATLTQHQLYSFEDNNDLITSKTALISDGGDKIAVLDDWSAGTPLYNLNVLAFYERGQRIRSYTLHDFLCSCGSISSSVSHFSWLTNYRFSPLTHTLTISTYELNTFTFDISTGQLLNKRLPPALTPTSILVAGQIQKLASKQFALTVGQRMHGTVPENGKVIFTSQAKFRSGDYLTLLIDQGQHIEVPGLDERSNLNSGSYKYEKKLHQEVESAGGLEKFTTEQKEFILGMSGCP